MNAAINLLLSLGGTLAFIGMVFLIAWLVTRNDYDMSAGLVTQEQRDAFDAATENLYEYYRDRWVIYNDYSALYEMTKYVEPWDQT